MNLCVSVDTEVGRQRTATGVVIFKGFVDCSRRLNCNNADPTVVISY